MPVASGRARLIGLARLDQEKAGPGLLIPRCRSVHTFGMRFPLDLVFLGKRQDIIRVVLRVRPRQTVTTVGASAVLEVVPHGEWPSLDGIGQVFAGARSMGGGELLPPAA